MGVKRAKLLEKYNSHDLEDIVEESQAYTNGDKKYYVLPDWIQYLKSIENYLKRIDRLPKGTTNQEEDSWVFWVNDQVRALTEILSDAHFILTGPDMTSGLNEYFEKYKKSRNKKLKKINSKENGNT